MPKQVTKPLIEAAIKKNRRDVANLFIGLVKNPPDISYPPTRLAPEKKIITEIHVAIDKNGSNEHLQAKLIVGYKIAELYIYGPVVPIYEFVQITIENGIVLIYESPCNGYNDIITILLNSRSTFWNIGYFPRLAIFHKKLQITGLSHEFGGWIGGTHYYYFDEITTICVE